MSDIDLEEIEREAKERDMRMQRMEDDGLKDIVKYFDRIHDKLFTLNNIFIAAYLALVALKTTLLKSIVLIPFVNLVLLIGVDWQMLKKSRLQSQITQVSGADLKRYGKIISNTNLYSLGLIVTTLAVAVAFIVYFFRAVL